MNMYVLAEREQLQHQWSETNRHEELHDTHRRVTR